MQIDNKTVTGNTNQYRPQAPAAGNMNQVFMAMIENMKRAKDMRQIGRASCRERV